MRTTLSIPTRSVIWILALLFAVGGIADASPAVLCVGDDGHADVEYSLSGCCVFDTEEFALPGPKESISRHPKCDDCVDLGLELISLTKGKRLHSVPPAITPRIPQPEVPEPGSTSAEAGRRSIHDSLFSMLSATVLLT